MIKVIDLEATCWNDGTNDRKSEIIEIGGVTIDLSTGKRIDEFQSFIKPILNPKLSDFCKQLTSIEQKDVDSARRFNEVYPRFCEWFGSKHKNTLASWGKYDKNQLIKDCDLHGLSWRLSDEHWNLKHMFEQRFKCEKMGLNTAVKMLNMSFEGIHHRGISDAQNAGNVLIRIFHADRV
jgi:inhibitor of KinA sporulation pathway (predicted exonuclease)